MSRKPVTLTYGTQERTYTLDESFIFGDPIVPRKVVLPPRDPLEVIREALASPLGSPRLRDMVARQRVCIVVSDDFRAGLQVEIASCLLDEVAAGGPSKITLFVATGTHSPEVYSKRIIGALERHARERGIAVDFVWHDTDESPRFELPVRTSFGTRPIMDQAYLKSDVRVYGHEAKHHYMAGYSSMDKQVIPGVSMRTTIEMNHKLSLDGDSRAGNISWHPDPARRRNPFSGDAREGRELAEGYVLTDEGELVERRVPTFGIDMISDKQDILWIAAGAVDEVCSRMPERADHFGAYVVERQRYVIISPGGPPACNALYGTQNCFDMALLGAILPGGEALIVAPCSGRADLPPEVSGLAPDRKSKELFYDNLVALQPRSLEECEAHIRDHFELYLWKTIRVLRLTKKHGLSLYLHSELPDEALTRAGLIPEHDPQRWLDERAARGDGRCTVIDGGNKLFVSGTTPGAV